MAEGTYPIIEVECCIVGAAQFLDNCLELAIIPPFKAW